MSDVQAVSSYEHLEESRFAAPDMSDLVCKFFRTLF